VLAEANQTDRGPLLRQWRIFPGEARQLSALRRWLTSFLPDCDARDDLVSVATELASNAVRHTRSGQGGHFAVEVSWYAGWIRLAVTDGGAPEGPKLITDPAGEHGRGLLLVRELAASTGVHGDRRSRRVWADVAFETGYAVLGRTWEPEHQQVSRFGRIQSGQLN
jgi:serine/threonine-protein kinase RsbW